MVLDVLACLILGNIFKNIVDFKHVLTTLNDFYQLSALSDQLNPGKESKSILFSPLNLK